MRIFGNADDLPEEIEVKINALIKKIEQIDYLGEISMYYGYPFANYAQTECQFRYCGTAIPFLTVRSTAR